MAQRKYRGLDRADGERVAVFTNASWAQELLTEAQLLQALTDGDVTTLLDGDTAERQALAALYRADDIRLPEIARRPKREVGAS